MTSVTAPTTQEIAEKFLKQRNELQEREQEESADRFHQAQLTDQRNAAEIVAEFYKHLIAKSVPAETAHALTLQRFLGS